MGCKNSKKDTQTQPDVAGGKNTTTEYNGNATNSTTQPIQRKPETEITTQDDNRNLYTAVYHYESRSDGDLEFVKGDILEVTDESSEDWWYAKSLRTNKEGYIPSNFVSRLKSIMAEEWYFGAILRSESREILSVDGLIEGSFLVRDSLTKTGFYVISIRVSKPNEQAKIVNTRVEPVRDENGGIKYCREKDVSFATLQDLIKYYKENVAKVGCKTRLTVSPMKEAPTTAGLARDEWEINRADIVLEEKLGHGNFGEVWKGTWKNKLTVAIKVTKEGAMNRDEFLGEAHTLKQLRHQHLLALQGVCTLEEPIYIVTELMVNGDLRSYLQKKDKAGLPIDMKDRVFIAVQITSGMQFLEKRKFVHRDLAARNILVGLNNHVKVADFGLSRLVNADIYESAGSKFPVKWTAPEALHMQQFSTKSDVWSFGILIYELESQGRIPYPGMKNNVVIEQLDKGYRMPQGRDCPNELYGIMKKCWFEKPDDRPSFEVLHKELHKYMVTLEKDAYSGSSSGSGR